MAALFAREPAKESKARPAASQLTRGRNSLMLWQGLSLLPLAVILGVWCMILELQLMGASTPKSNKVPCFFAATLLFAAVCLAIASAFDEPAVMPSMPG